MSVDADSLEVKVIDDGTGMKKQPPRPDIDRKMLGEEDPRGMGMFLIQALVDEAEWVERHRWQKQLCPAGHPAG